MSSASRISETIQKKLNRKRKILSRQGSSDIFSPSDENSKKEYQQNIVKTPYIIMASSQQIQKKEEDGDLTDTDFPKGFYMLSNQEYSDDNQNINVGTNLYNARSISSKTKVPYRPAPGIKDLTSEFTSTNNTFFNRKVTVNFTCYSLQDLEFLSERFMTFNRYVFVQWGWATNENISPLLDENGDIKFDGENAEKKSDVVKLQEMVIKNGKGDFDAVVGYVSNFNYTLREDGGFDCTTELLTQGLNIFDNVLPTGNTPETTLFNKGIKTNDTTFNETDTLFKQEISNLHNQERLVGRKTQKIYDSFFTITPEDDPEEKEIKIKPQKISKSFRYNENFILTYESKNYSDDKFDKHKTIDYSETNREFKAKRDTKHFGSGYFTNITTETDPNECWVRWGWLEDNIINKYFALYSKKSNQPVSHFRSIEPNPTAKAELQESREENNPFSGSGVKVYGGAPTQTVQYSIDNNGTHATIIDETDSLSVPFFQSKRINSDKDFRTTDISQFLFPGKFDITPKIPQQLTDKIKELEGKLPTTNDLELGNITSAEKKIQEEFAELIEQERDLQERINEFEDLQTLKQKISEAGASVDNADQITETGYDKYLYLAELQNILSQKETIKQFDTNDAPKENGRKKGFLRNIFINIGFLQNNIFKNSGGSTLGETMNLLFKQLNSNTNGLIDLVIRYNNELNQYTVEERKPGESYEEQVELINKQTYGIYEFPVHQQDSMVLSQELTSDLSSTQFTIIQAKNLAAQSEEIGKKNISLQHQQNLNNTLTNGAPVAPEQYTTRNDLSTAVIKYGDDYGNYSADENVLISQFSPKSNSGQSSSNKSRESATTRLNTAKAKDLLVNIAKQSEKDLESAQGVFTELPTPYTIEGRLKNDYYEEMVFNTSLEIVEIPGEEGQEPEKKVYIKVSDYGFVGLTTTLTLTGIAGIYPSNIFTTSYLPEKFKVNNIGGCHFWTTNVTQNCSAESWTTQLEGRVAWRYVK